MINSILDYRNRLCLVVFNDDRHVIGLITTSGTFVSNPKYLLEFFITEDGLALNHIHSEELDLKEIKDIYFLDTQHPKKFTKTRD